MEIKSRKTYYTDSDMLVEYEQMGDIVNMHLSATRFSPSVLKRMYIGFARMTDDFKKQGISTMMTISPNPKFCKLFGGTPIGYLVFDGIEHEVIVWELK